MEATSKPGGDAESTTMPENKQQSIFEAGGDENLAAGIAEADQLWQDAIKVGGTKDHAAVLAHLEKLEATYGNNVDIMWRLARACKDNALGGAIDDSAAQKEMILRGLAHAEDAVKTKPDYYKSHLWMGTLMGVAVDNGVFNLADKIQNAFKICKSYQQAVELNKEDAECAHCLGQFNFGLASLGWLERKVVGECALIGLKGSFEEALALFTHSAELDSTYNTNTYMLALTHSKMGDKEQAKEWVHKTLALTDKDADDVETREKAEALKAELGA